MNMLRAVTTGVFSGLFMFACRQPRLVVRTDVEPIALRVQLPTSVRQVRWVSRPLVADNGCVPAHDSPYVVDVFAAPVATTEETSAKTTQSIPYDVAQAILPSSLLARSRVAGGSLEVTGVSWDRRGASRNSTTAVDWGIVTPEGLVLSLSMQ